MDDSPRAEITQHAEKQDAITEAILYLSDPADTRSVTVEPWKDGWRVITFKEERR